jgi:hypothetical protein
MVHACTILFISLVHVGVVVLRGVVSCKITLIVFVVWPPLCTRENEAHNILAKISIVETTRSIRERSKIEHHLCVWRRPVTIYEFT